MGDFASFHPIVLFVYYIIVLAFSMLTLHPVPIVVSMTGAFVFYAVTHKVRVTLSEAFFYLIVFILLSITNPLFVHNGETILFFMNDHPITLEAVFYGMAMAGMLIAVLYWCKCYNLVLTSDKFLYLFGKAIPKLSLVLSMALRFIPLFKKHAEDIKRVQKTMGMYAGTGFVDKLLYSLRIFDGLVGWSLENAIDTADSMKARGYGLKGRSNFSIFRFEKKDGILLILIGIFAVIVLSGFLTGTYFFYYYPVTGRIINSTELVIQTAALSGLMMIPAFLEIKERIKWKYLKSSI